MTAKRVPEKVVQQQIVAALRAIGAVVYVLGHPSPADGRRFRGTGQTPGIPDLFAFVPARVLATQPTLAVFIEVKAAGGRLRPEQADFRDRCRGTHVHHVVGDLDAVYAWMLGQGVIKDSQVPHYRLPGAAANG